MDKSIKQWIAQKRVFKNNNPTVKLVTKDEFYKIRSQLNSTSLFVETFENFLIIHFRSREILVDFAMAENLIVKDAPLKYQFATDLSSTERESYIKRRLKKIEDELYERYF